MLMFSNAKIKRLTCVKWSSADKVVKVNQFYFVIRQHCPVQNMKIKPKKNNNNNNKQ